MRVLLVEDTERLSQALVEILRKAGYEVDAAHDGVTGADMAAAGIYDVILLDIMLPRRSGIDVLRDLREAGNTTPVILLTARDAVTDRVHGLDAGADDYLPKPFHASELLARIRAVTRRPAAWHPSNAIVAAGLELDSAALEVRLAGASPTEAAPIELTSKESQLLEALMRAERRVASKDDLIARLWGPQASGAQNRLEVLVHALRDKLSRLNAATSVETVRGVGYRLRATGAPERKGMP